MKNADPKINMSFHHGNKKTTITLKGPDRSKKKEGEEEGGSAQSNEESREKSSEAKRPTFTGFLKKTRIARAKTPCFLNFICAFFCLVFGTLGVSMVCVALFSVLPISISTIVVGALYRHSCPIQPYIPIYLIVFGAFLSLLLVLVNIRKIETAFLISHIILFLLAWFITGCIWTYTVYPPEFQDPTSPSFCHKTVYLFAFWFNSLTLFLVGGIFSILAICCVVAFFTMAVEVEENEVGNGLL